MAKRKKKAAPSGYEKQRRRLMAAVRREEKKGRHVVFDLPTQKQLKEAGVTGAKLSALTRKLARVTPKVLRGKYLAAEYDPETGWVKNIREPEQNHYIPEAGLIAYENAKELFKGYGIYFDIADKMISNNRPQGGGQEIVEMKMQVKSHIMTLMFSIREKGGENAAGYRLYQEGMNHVQDWMEYILYGSSATKIQAASASLISTLIDRPLTFSEMTRLGEYQDEFGSFDLYD